MNAQLPISGPYIHPPTRISQLMGLVMVALLPATLYGFYLFGWPALYLWLATVAAALAAEAACLALAGQPRSAVGDGSAALTGWLLALSLPPWAPWWVGALGSALAMGLGKHVFGGLGQNPFNPAMVGRVILLVAYPAQMTLWTPPAPLGSPQAPGPLDSLAITFGTGGALDGISAASPLGGAKTALSQGLSMNHTLAGYDWMNLGMGHHAGSMGETSLLLLGLGGAFLLYRRVITWHIPAALLATLLLLAQWGQQINPSRFGGWELHLLTGATVFGALFIATDPVTSPVSPTGQLVYGAGLGLIIYLIRNFAAYPEGMAFAVLLMNALTPLIDRYLRPRVFGHAARQRASGGRPLQEKP